MLRKLVKEPLVHFMLIGAAIFAANAWFSSPESGSEPVIEITSSDIDRMAALWEKQWQRTPTESELRGLIEGQVREEILYREALAMGLDQNDTVVRRRLAQKLEFLTEDLTPIPEPDEATLQSFLEERAETYAIPGRVSFAHVYFSPDKRGTQVDADAGQALLALTAAGGASADAGQGMGDAFLLEYAYSDISLEEIARLFGDGFADALKELPEDAWSGPVRSGYGLHLVRVGERIAARRPALDEVRDAVLRDYRQLKREEANRAFYEALKARYRISIDEGAIATAFDGRVAEQKR